MEMIGSSSDGEQKDVFDFDLTKNWITRRALELLLPSLEETAKSEFPIWFKAKVAAEFEAKSKLPMGKTHRKHLQSLHTRLASIGHMECIIAQHSERDSIDRSDKLQELQKTRKRVEAQIEEVTMDFTLSDYCDLINFFQHQMKKLAEPSYFFSTEGKAVAGLWSDSGEIQSGLNKLLSASAQIEEIPELAEKLRLVSYCNTPECNSDAIQEEEEQFAGYRHMWEVFNGNKFDELTSLSSMIFTHCAPGRMPSYAVVKPTLQIISIKIIGLTSLEWPLKIYGIIAARDAVDNRRNPIFFCQRNGVQLVTQQDPFLRLTGPSRAVVCEERVTIEVQLKMKGRIESEDKVLMSTKLYYNQDSAGSVCTINTGNHFCRMEFCCQKVEKSVQATITSVRVVQWPFSFQEGAQVFCSSLSRGCEDGDISQPCPRLLLHDSKHGIKNMDGHLDVHRNVVSAELGGKIKILIKDCALGGIAGHVLFTPKKCNFSQAMCHVGTAQVEVTIAWSMLVKDDECILSSSYVDPFEVCPPLNPSVLSFLKTAVAEESMKTGVNEE